MMTEPAIPIENRILQLLQHLQIAHAHFAGCMLPDWRGFAAQQQEMVSSLSLVCPWGFDLSTAQVLASRLLVIHGDQGPMGERVRGALANVPEASQVTLHGYAGLLWDDMTADRKDEIGSAILDFLEGIASVQKVEAILLSKGEGEVAGISYRLQGSGPPLVLFPLGFAPSQWEPLLPRLSQRYCTLTLGGPLLGGVGALEARAGASGYLRVVQRVIDEVRLRSGERVLDVGCGSGAIDRWLARRPGGTHRITGVDVNPYLLREATALVRREGLESIIEFREGDAESLPFDDNTFSAAISFTVMEEADADRTLAEMVRVTRPGGRVAAIVRAQDLPLQVNFPLRAELKAKLEVPVGAGVVAGGCADASLYRRFHQAGLSQVQILPDRIVYTNPQGSMEQALLGTVLGTLGPEEMSECREAIAQAESEGTFFFTQPMHCAVGTKS